MSARDDVAPRRSETTWRTGMARATLRSPLIVLVALVVAVLLGGEVSTWGGSPRLLLGSELPALFFFLLPLGAVIGVVSGQARWRSGVVTWQALSPRPNAELMGRAATAAMLMALAAVGLPVALLSAVASVDLSRHVPVAIVLRELGGGLGPTLVILVGVMVMAALGALLGWASGKVWMPPLALVMSLALMMAIPLQFSRGADPDRVWSDTYGYTDCRTSDRHDVTVCSTPPTSGYLPAAVARIDELYDQAPADAPLPRRVRLNSQETAGVQAPGSIMIPTLGLNRARGFTPPSTLPSSAADSLAYSTHAWCPGADLSDVQQLFGIEPSHHSSSMPRTLRLLAACRDKQ